MTYAPSDPATAPALLDALNADRSGDPLADLRHKARQQFSETGLPTVKNEAWRYTSLKSLQKLKMVAATDSAGVVDALPTVRRAGQPAARLVVVNGRFRADLSDTAVLAAEKARAVPLREAMQISNEDLSTVLGGMARIEADPMVALNTAGLDDGLAIAIGADTTVGALIEIVYVTTGSDMAASDTDTPLSQPRTIIVAGRNSHATVVEHHIGIGTGSAVSNLVTEVGLSAGATLRHYIAQRAGSGTVHVASTSVWVNADASYQSFALNLGGKLARHQIDVQLLGKGASCTLDGAYMISGDQHSDTTTRIEHRATDTTSREVYKGTIDGRARGVFAGKIIVHRGAQKTDGHQLSRALLLSDTAEIDAKPELEIYADDVKCSHGSTCGELDDAALFFLRSRGIPKDEARALLIAAFVHEAIDSIADVTVRDAFAAMVETHLERG